MSFGIFAMYDGPSLRRCARRAVVDAGPEHGGEDMRVRRSEIGLVRQWNSRGGGRKGVREVGASVEWHVGLAQPCEGSACAAMSRVGGHVVRERSQRRRERERGIGARFRRPVLTSSS